MSERARARAAAAVEVTPEAAAPEAADTGRRRRAAAAETVAEVAPVAAAAEETAEVSTAGIARRRRAAGAEVAAPTEAAAPTADAAAPEVSTRRSQKKAPAADDVAADAHQAAPQAAAATSSSGSQKYDTMTYEDFLKELRTVSKATVVEQMQARREAEEQSNIREKDTDIEAFTDGTGGYSYLVLLDRVYDELKSKNPSLGAGESRNQIPVPQIERYGSKKTAVANFKKICDAINRSMEEVKDFIEKELSTVGSIDSMNCLILKLQNVKTIQFESIIIKYVDEYVKCHACKKINTTLNKEDRITVLKCNLCQATRTVTSGSSSAFHAVVGKRSKLRAANAL